MRTGQLDDRFGDPAATAPSWEAIEGLIDQAELYWLTTVRSDGADHGPLRRTPHVTPLVGVWNEGQFAFCTGVGEQKHVNLQYRGEGDRLRQGPALADDLSALRAVPTGDTSAARCPLIAEVGT